MQGIKGKQKANETFIVNFDMIVKQKLSKDEIAKGVMKIKIDEYKKVDKIGT